MSFLERIIEGLCCLSDVTAGQEIEKKSKNKNLREKRKTRENQEKGNSEIMIAKIV